MENNPLVTVNILSYNRKDELRNTLQKVFEQDYKNIEVIVVDNCSTDGTVEMVTSEFPIVSLIRLNKNIGIAGWNRGFEVAKGEYILVLDDDAYPSRDAVEKSLFEFEKDSFIVCITLNVIDTNDANKKRCSWIPQEDIEKCEWPIFVGCAVIFKNIGSIIYMPEEYFLYQHELPVAAEIYINKFKIFYKKDIIAFHFFKNKNYYNKHHDILRFKNNIHYILKYIPFTVVIFYLIQQLLFYLSRSLRKRWFGNYLNILFHINFSIIFHKKISIRYLWSLRPLTTFNYSLFSKLIRK
ncbi:MAG: glycosyltransferase [Melioribacteraceae bacterium]